jgi:hypothetical protein
MAKNNQGFSPADLAQAMNLLQNMGQRTNGHQGNQRPQTQPQYIPNPNPGTYGPAQPYQATQSQQPQSHHQPQAYQATQPAYNTPTTGYSGEEADDSLILQMVGQIEGNLRPEGVEVLWLKLGNLILHRQRINRFELLKGIGFYTLSFCLPWLVIKAMWFGKAIAGTAFLIVSKSIFPFAALILVGALMFIYREPTKTLTLLEIIIGFMISLIIFSLL